jgi:hypothetical protein
LSREQQHRIGTVHQIVAERLEAIVPVVLGVHVERSSRIACNRMSATARSWPCSGSRGCCTVEIQRANRNDVQQRADGWALLLRGKFHDRLVYLRQEVAEAVTGYLGAQERTVPDNLGTPLFIAVSNRARGNPVLHVPVKL